MALVDIKNRLEVTANTRKITQALQLVAANKMKAYQRKALSVRRYAQELLSSLDVIAGNLSDLPFSEQRTKGKDLFVLVTSNKGLCGTLNNRLISHLFQSKEWREADPENRLLMTIGKKGYDTARRSGIPVEMSFEGIKERLDAFEALEIIQKIVEYWENGTCRRVMLVSPHYVSPFESRATLRTYLPFSLEMIGSHKVVVGEAYQTHGLNEKLIYFEPDEGQVINRLSLQIVEALLTQAFYELKASEYSSRMVAMKKASDAAEEMVELLKTEYNKTRQSIITQQLAELATASEAMEEEPVVQAAGKKPALTK